MEVLVNDKSSIVNETVVVDGGENVLVDISVSGGDQDSAINLFFVLLSLLLLFNEISLLVLAGVAIVFTGSSVTTTHV